MILEYFKINRAPLELLAQITLMLTLKRTEIQPWRAVIFFLLFQGIALDTSSITKKPSLP